MNFLVSNDWLREFVRPSVTPEAFASQLSLAGPGIEKLFPAEPALEGIILGQIKVVEPHPHADRLRIVSTDVGSKILRLVCGGSNLVPDQWVAVALVGARVRWHGEGDWSTLEPAEIRGIPSEGMICGANEIGLFDAFPHADKEILDMGRELAWKAKTPFQAGTPLAHVLGLEHDVIFDVEVTSNRPDLMSVLGLAREASAILREPLHWKPKDLPQTIHQPNALSVEVKEKKTCPRYLGVRIDHVRVGPSPWWMKRRLLASGLRPINNIVDITNYVTLELGQPMHVFDADTLAHQTIVVRSAKKNESLKALDGKTYALEPGMLVIADQEKPVAVAGIMGGEATSVTPRTRSVVFEAATFDGVLVRQTARRLNLYSDAQLRFEKGLSSEAVPVAMARAIELCHQLAGGTMVAGPLDVYASHEKPKTASLAFAEADRLIGIVIQPAEQIRLLEQLGFTVKKQQKKQITVTVPWWRDRDVKEGCDLVEEISRIEGYGRIPAIFPAAVSHLPEDPSLHWERAIREHAKTSGLTEIYTYSLVSRALLERTDYQADKLLRLVNPLSEDFEFLRTCLLPSMLDVLAQNQERKKTLRLFEVANVYFPTSSGLPDERSEGIAAFYGMREPWREAKGYAESLLQAFGIESAVWKRISEDTTWHPYRTVQIFDGETLLATAGEIHPRLCKNGKLDQCVGCVLLAVPELARRASSVKKYVAPPLFPEAKRDIAVIVDRKTEVASLVHVMRDACPVLHDAEWFDTYEGKELEQGKKSLAFHLTFGADDHTLEQKEVEEARAQILRQLVTQCSATVREE